MNCQYYLQVNKIKHGLKEKNTAKHHYKGSSCVPQKKCSIQFYCYADLVIILVKG
jgi:hypothetical protein